MKVWIDVLGCPKNEADSDAVKFRLIERGHEIVEDLNEADVAVLNTCAFISDAKKESIDEIFSIIDHKNRQKKRSLKIVVHGCLVQRYFENLRDQIPEVDALVGVASPESIVKAVENLEDFIALPDPVYEFSGRTSDGKSYAYVKVGDGCNKNCAFCAIPSIKGRLKNRKFDDIIEEIRYFVKAGKREIILVSQDLTSYSDGERNLVDLLERIDVIKGNFWVRLLYLYPDGVDDDLIDFVKRSKKVLHYFDIPVQHASGKILKLMSRNSDINVIKKKLLSIRERIPDAILRTTLILGFPGEDEEDFKLLKSFVKEIEFDRLGTFIYSDEEGTAAYSIFPKVEKSVARRRANSIMEIQRRMNLLKNERFIGKEMKVLVDETEGEGYAGRTYMDAPEIDGSVHFVSSKSLKPGDFVEVRIDSCEFYDLEGSVV